ncbi:hypothetical protein A8W25_16190 [Streptomyces sp. ERV7]|uniref:hypothetical protein n=1 Tax=Streptomyces sp. ERV7 TaxID=1322334 RepID=UPI0007F518DE|nr:hypothetical protein [Streptomyces sp. ERV7]OAR24007.1 hypothetical protein A8W25_16190 [Streptomyces sp. ERV7]
MRSLRRPTRSRRTAVRRTLRLPRWLAVAAVPMAVLALSTPAHAGVLVFSNGFEGGQLDKWDRPTGGDAWAGFEVNTGTAHWGQNNGWLSARQGWAREGTWAALNGISWNSTCAARIYVWPQNGVEFALRVWDANGNKLGETVPWLNASNGYQTVDTPAWSPRGNTNVFVEAVISSYDGTTRTVRVDDLAVQCTTDS